VTPEDVDVSMVFYREEGRWNVAALPARGSTTMDNLLDALRRFPGEGGVMGAVAVGDEFFVLVRESGQGRRLMLSDGASTLDWSLADEAATLIGFDDDDPEEYEPIGDVDLLEDFGVNPDDIVAICQNEDLYPDEQLGAIAERLGFADQWQAALNDAR
jgi:putative tRNA adenosine deaminase-associated protein